MCIRSLLTPQSQSISLFLFLLFLRSGFPFSIQYPYSLLVFMPLLLQLVKKCILRFLPVFVRFAYVKFYSDVQFSFLILSNRVLHFFSFLSYLYMHDKGIICLIKAFIPIHIPTFHPVKTAIQKTITIRVRIPFHYKYFASNELKSNCGLHQKNYLHFIKSCFGFFSSRVGMNFVSFIFSMYLSEFKLYLRMPIRPLFPPFHYTLQVYLMLSF